MKANPIKELRKYGQSLWLDNIRRALITSGALQKLIDDGLMGVTSNPTIFEKAIAGSKDYDEQMRSLISEGRGVPEILNALTVQDIQMAADLFRPIYEKTKGEDGFVSIELDPTLAHRTDATLQVAKSLHPLLNRKNVMIKVPATAEGIPAIEALTAEGFSINVTLIFSVEQYEQVARAYIAGLKKWVQQGRSSESVRSVASVFVSRLDTVVDRLIDDRLHAAKTASEREILRSLLGKAGIANAKRIYQKFKEIFHGPAFLDLQKQGAAPQRPLWASTGTKNPNYSDLLYVEALIGPNTVNTVPPATLTAFQDHGKVQASLEENLEEARAVLEKLEELGIDLREQTERLQEEGVASFSDSFQKLTRCIAAKRERMLGKHEARFSDSLGKR